MFLSRFACRSSPKTLLYALVPKGTLLWEVVEAESQSFWPSTKSLRRAPELKCVCVTTNSKLRLCLAHHAYFFCMGKHSGEATDRLSRGQESEYRYSPRFLARAFFLVTQQVFVSSPHNNPHHLHAREPPHAAPYDHSPLTFPRSTAAGDSRAL